MQNYAPAGWVPPAVSDLWPALRDRLRSPEVEASLATPAGQSRVYVEGEQSGFAEMPETEPWGRVVVVPANEIGGRRWEPGVPVFVHFLVRAEVNSRARKGTYRHLFHLERILRQALARLQNFGGPIASTEVEIRGAVQPVEPWDSQMLDDRQASGTFQLSQKYEVQVAEAVTAL